MVRSTEYPTSSATGALHGRSILSFRRNQVVSMEPNEDQVFEQLQLFQNQVAVRLLDLSPSSSSDRLLSISWLQKLLDAFLCCEEEFKAIVFCKAKPPNDRLLADFLDRALKSLDICNAVTHGVDSLQRRYKQAEIAVAALNQTPLGQAQIRRAIRALNSIPAGADAGDGYGTGERAWSFGRKGSSSRGGAGAVVTDGGGGAHSRSFSGTVSRTWSAAKQVQAIAANLAPPPRVGEIGGLGLPVYAMNMVLVFVMWALVVAIPCQDGGSITMHFPVVARHLAWAAPMSRLHEGIVKEWKKEKKGWVGLLEELQRLENCRQELMEVGDSVRFPMEEERAAEIRRIAADLTEICRNMEDGLGPLRCRVREVFNRIVRSRAEVLDCLDQANRSSAVSF